jgi:hypothetical protein
MSNQAVSGRERAFRIVIDAIVVVILAVLIAAFLG